MALEKAIKITAKLYECRDTARRFYGDKFPEKISVYQDNIRRTMQHNNVDELKAILIISSMAHYKECGVVQMLYMAAVAEMIEPSKPTENA